MNTSTQIEVGSIVKCPMGLVGWVVGPSDRGADHTAFQAATGRIFHAPTAQLKVVRGAMATPPADDTARTVDMDLSFLRRCANRNEAADWVRQIKGHQLAALARELNVPRGRVADMRESIVESTVGVRLNSAAIRGL